MDLVNLEPLPTMQTRSASTDNCGGTSASCHHLDPNTMPFRHRELREALAQAESDRDEARAQKEAAEAEAEKMRQKVVKARESAKSAKESARAAKETAKAAKAGSEAERVIAGTEMK